MTIEGIERLLPVSTIPLLWPDGCGGWTTRVVFEYGEGSGRVRTWYDGTEVDQTELNFVSSILRNAGIRESAVRYPMLCLNGFYVDHRGPTPVVRPHLRVMRMVLESLGRDPYTCERCGAYKKNSGHIHIHHVIPRLMGGDDDPENVRILCPKCHKIEEGGAS